VISDVDYSNAGQLLRPAATRERTPRWRLPRKGTNAVSRRSLLNVIGQLGTACVPGKKTSLEIHGLE
jgi:hypothetical protein